MNKYSLQLIKCSRNKSCKLIQKEIAVNGNFICSGIRNKPKKYKHDKIGLCLDGKFSKFSMEMTPDEAIDMMFCLTKTLFYNKK